ncbi:MAG TPA: glycosyltransferase family 2 protein [Candidatus Tripitaka californicus]|uniref:glycosyltransferase family 2 protein n=1 Tax=Candidatus Tripitaka californicus TaxID=3367616 RepID=UPI004027CCF5
MPQELSIIIVNWNTRDLLQECLESLYKTTNVPFDLYVVDNASTDDSPGMVRAQFPQARLVVNQENLGFAPANNQILKGIHTPFVFLLNPDTVLLEGAITGMLDFLKATPDAAIVAPQYLNKDGTRQNSFDNFPSLATELLNKGLLRALLPGWFPSKRGNHKGPLEVESVIGAAMMLRQEVFRQVGFFDEDYFLYLDESDLCFRLKKAGWRCLHLPHLRIYHVGGGGKRKVRAEATIEYYRSLYKFFRKNRGWSSYALLRAFKPLRVFLSLVLSGLGTLLTLGMNERFKVKFLTCIKLLEWHLRGCPDWMGIQKGPAPMVGAGLKPAPTNMK